MRKINVGPLALLALLSATLLTNASLAAPLDEVPLAGSSGRDSGRKLAEARKSVQWTPKAESARVDFDFGGITAWLRADGNWYTEGWVNHGALRCGTYRLGIRFGTGKPGCSNVTWLTEPRFVTHRKHCNSARLRHAGGDEDLSIKTDFSRITCAERVIKCTGTCK